MFQLETSNGYIAIPIFFAYFCYPQQLENWPGRNCK